MSPKQFFAGLLATSIIQISIILVLIMLFASMRAHIGFMIVTISAMFIFCTLLFGAAKILARSSYTKLYIQLIMLAVFLKMILCVALILGYQKGYEPADNSFIWPFLVIYLASTIYEVIFLEKVGREKQSTTP